MNKQNIWTYFIDTRIVSVIRNETHRFEHTEQHEGGKKPGSKFPDNRDEASYNRVRDGLNKCLNM